MLDEILAVLLEIAVHDQARVVRHAGNDGDVGLLELQLDRVIVDPLDRALAGLFGGGIDQRGHARRHRIALGALVAPAIEIEDDVVGVELVAVVPGRALAHVQRIFGRVLVHFPALEQHRLEGEFTRVLHQRLEELPGDVGHFRPVVGAGVLLVLDEHADLQHAALLGRLRERAARRREADHAVGRRGRGAENARQREEFTTVHLAGLGVNRERLDGGGNPPGVFASIFHWLPPL